MAGATAIGTLFGDRLALADDAMLFLAAIMVAAMGGRGPGLVAAALSVAAYDFFFIPPRFTFAVADLRHIITFAVMFTVGLAMGSLVARLRERERRVREEALRARTEELRSSLLSAVSHDLRTPLASILGMATALRDSARPDQVEALDTMADEARRLGAILTNLLAITRVESGQAVQREWVPAEELVGSALARSAALLAGRAVAVKVAPDAAALVDPILIEQLLLNLLENAAKHTPPGSPLEVSARREGERVRIAVEDRGPGLPAIALFEKFVRGPRPTTAGAGLGLAVCRGIAVAHGGAIEALPREGGGASFVVWLPGGEPAPAEELVA